VNGDDNSGLGSVRDGKGGATTDGALKAIVPE
jgi:hypothetical protein